MKLYLTGEPCTQQRHCYFVEGETASFIMDCGYQRCYRGDELPHLLPEQIRAARYLFLSHSHENQSGALPYLLANGIQLSRNTPDMTAASSIRQANQGSYDFYLAIHSNASGSGSEGQTRGIIIFLFHQERNNCRVNLAAACAHNQALKRCIAHARINRFAVFDCRDAGTVAQMAADDTQIIHMLLHQLRSTQSHIFM